MVFLSYLSWHYTKAPRDILGLLNAYIIGTWHRFLIGRHAKTLFAPWHRVQPSDIGKPRDTMEVVVTPVIDLYIRLLAAAIRFSIILAGLIVEFVVLIVFLLLLLLWIAWPLVLIVAFIQGISLL